jgi:ribosomal protein S21
MQRQKDYGMTVFVGERGIEEAIRRFKKRVEKSEILDFYKEKQYYVKPSLKRHQEKQAQKRNNK